MPVLPPYVSIDAPCANWCILHAISYALCHEYTGAIPQCQLSNLFAPQEDSAAQVIRELKKNWGHIGLSEALQDTLMSHYAEPIAIAQKIVNFLHRSRKNLTAQRIQEHLSPLVYHLYQKLALIPPTEELRLWHRHMLAGLLGTQEHARHFINSLCASDSPTENRSTYQQDLKKRFEYLSEKINDGTNAYRQYDDNHCGQKRSIRVALEPLSHDAEQKKQYRLCQKMAGQICQLFFKPSSQPDIQVQNILYWHEFEIFGSNARYVLKGAGEHLKLLINTADAPEASEIFSKAKGFDTHPEFSWRSFLTPLYDRARWFCFKVLPFIAAGLLVAFFLRRRSASPPPKVKVGHTLSQVKAAFAPPQYEINTLPQVRGVLLSRKPHKSGPVRVKPLR